MGDKAHSAQILAAIDEMWRIDLQGEGLGRTVEISFKIQRLGQLEVYVCQGEQAVGIPEINCKIYLILAVVTLLSGRSGHEGGECTVHSCLQATCEG